MKGHKTDKSQFKNKIHMKKKVENCDFSCLNPKYVDADFKTSFNDCWRNNGPNIHKGGSEGVNVMKDPFNCAFLPDLFNDTQFLSDVTAELNKLTFRPLNNDLYKFKTTGVLPEKCDQNLQKMCSLLRGPVKQWVQDLCGIKLNEFVSVNSSKYKYSDTLLCHDDELECRRIAFILYLSPEWKLEYGGTLDLFSVDELGRPKKVEKRIVPQLNGFSFFEVSPSSYHQVSEILSRTETRISINGWFHGASIPFPKRQSLRPHFYRSPGHAEERVVYSWINPLYLEQTTQLNVLKEFQDKSEIQLPEFLKNKKFVELSNAMKKDDLQWQFVGPPYKRHYEVICGSKMPEIVREFVSLLCSEAMVLILSQLTGLRLHRLAPPDEESSSDEESPPPSSGEDASDEDNNEEKKSSSRCYNDSRPYSSSSSSSEDDVQKTSNKRSKSRKKNKKRKKMLGEATAMEDPWVSDGDSDLPAHDTGDNVVAMSEVTSEVRRWRWGSYSLMRDDDLTHNSDFTLDSAFFCNGTQGWNQRLGGDTIFVAKGETEQLLTILPKPNTLALVYRDADTFKFTKYINIKSSHLHQTKNIFHEFNCQYRETKNKLS